MSQVFLKPDLTTLQELSVTVIVCTEYLADRRTGVLSTLSVCQVCVCPGGPLASLLGAPSANNQDDGLCRWHQLSHGLSVRNSNRCPHCLRLDETPAVSFRVQGEEVLR